MKEALINDTTEQIINHLAINSQKHIGFVQKAYLENNKVIYIGKRISDGKPWRSDSPTLINPNSLDNETKQIAIMNGYVTENVNHELQMASSY
jgi:hypothetical protein